MQDHFIDRVSFPALIRVFRGSGTRPIASATPKRTDGAFPRAGRWPPSPLPAFRYGAWKESGAVAAGWPGMTDRRQFDVTRTVLTPGGLHDRAEAAVRRRLAAEPRDTGALWKLGEIHRRQGNLAAAHDVYRRLSAHDGPDRHKASWLSAVLGGGGVPEAVAPRGVWPAPFVRMTDFLAPGQCDRLMALARAGRGRLTPAMVGAGPHVRVDPEVRMTFEADARTRQEFRPWFLPMIRNVVPEVLARLRMEDGGRYRTVLRMRVYPAGGYYWAHQDNMKNRKLSFVYFFHPEPRRFSGGDLLLYDADADTAACPFKAFSRIVPLCNSIVFFPSRAWHQVAPVSCDADDFESGRFVVNGHLEKRGGDAAADRPPERRGDGPGPPAKEPA